MEEEIEEMVREMAQVRAWMMDEDIERFRHMLYVSLHLGVGDVEVLIEVSHALWVRSVAVGDRRCEWVFYQEYQWACAAQRGEEYQWPEMPAWLAQLP